MLNFFGRGKHDTATYFKEPTLGSTVALAPEPELKTPASEPTPPPVFPRTAKVTEPEVLITRNPTIPSDYAGLVDYFSKTVSERRSPYNALVQEAGKLQEFIPDEISRLKAAYMLNSGQWSPELLALAINTHLADVDRAWNKARRSQGAPDSKEADHLRHKIKHVQEQNAALDQKIAALQEALEQHQRTQAANASEIGALSQQLQLADAQGSAGTYLDQAAENLKNDLLAKKVLLGLP